MKVEIFSNNIATPGECERLEAFVNNFLKIKPKATVEWMQSAVSNARSGDVFLYLTAIITY